MYRTFVLIYEYEVACSWSKDPCSVAGPGRRPAGDPGDGLCGARLAGGPGGLADSTRRAGRVRVLPTGSPLTPASSA